MEIESVTELFNNIKNRGNNQSTELLKVLVAEHPTNQAAVDYAKNATKVLETNSIPFI